MGPEGLLSAYIIHSRPIGLSEAIIVASLVVCELWKELSQSQKPNNSWQWLGSISRRFSRSFNIECKAA
ncbi:hypothetical protein AB205_0198230 [Aquarana catesbeiana]|uniref:Uncharacterized protein n=1 Tax=Aquarana catesbeiana TaxID=8400 RepID=A0A2G9RYA4_AQUCT|nr:hypothetical protein AB205_0198230 [Aquarana catesbeiana]